MIQKWSSALDPQKIKKMQEELYVLEECLIEEPMIRYKALIEFPQKKREKTEKQIEIVRRNRAYERLYLLDRLLILQAKYEEVQKSKIILHVLKTNLHAYPFTKPLHEALEFSQFEKMGKAIQFLETVIRNMPRTATDEVDPLATKPIWEIPQAPTDF